MVKDTTSTQCGQTDGQLPGPWLAYRGPADLPDYWYVTILVVPECAMSGDRQQVVVEQSLGDTLRSKPTGQYGRHSCTADCYCGHWRQSASDGQRAAAHFYMGELTHLNLTEAHVKR